MKDRIHTMMFAIILGIVCSGLLAGANILTAPYRAANEKAEEVRNVLGVLKVPVPPEAGAKDLIELFNAKVVEKKSGTMSLYEYSPKGPGTPPEAVAIYVGGPGLWGPIKGVVALAADLTTVLGISFYKQEETPGLGGDISTTAFCERFATKKMVTADGKPGFRITKPGQAKVDNEVDGISGATMTCDRVQAILEGLAKDLEQVRGGKP